MAATSRRLVAGWQRAYAKPQFEVEMLQVSRYVVPVCVPEV